MLPPPLIHHILCLSLDIYSFTRNIYDLARNTIPNVVHAILTISILFPLDCLSWLPSRLRCLCRRSVEGRSEIRNQPSTTAIDRARFIAWKEGTLNDEVSKLTYWIFTFHVCISCERSAGCMASNRELLCWNRDNLSSIWNYFSEGGS